MTSLLSVRELKMKKYHCVGHNTEKVIALKESQDFNMHKQPYSSVLDGRYKIQSYFNERF